MSEKPKFMTHERIMAGEEYVSYSDYLLLQRERDEAREELKAELARIQLLLLDPHGVFLNFLHGKIAKLDWDKLEHIHGPHPARVERDEAREVLREIAEASGFDNIGNWARNKARKEIDRYR